ncbi:MAG: hypothetical protein ACKVKH_00040 [Verrucomicrobiales bacterium]
MPLIAASRYEMVGRVANIVAPSMIAVFATCGLVALHQMNITSASSPSEGKSWTEAVGSVGSASAVSLSPGGTLKKL